jgi:4-hydroxy-tetrahydrodipicolinate synthase
MFLLSEEERHRLARVAVKVAGGRVPVVATGSFGDDAPAQAASVRRMADTGVDAVVLVLPPFAQTEAELGDYFETVLDATDGPLGLYECPVPTRRSLPTALVGRLARTGRFVCYKETSCDPVVLAAQCAATAGTPLAVLQANTPYLLEARRLGCPGSMCISANVAPELVRDVLTLPDEDASEPHRRLCAIDAIVRLNHPTVAKFLLAERGLPIGLTNRKRTAPLTGEARVMLREAWRFLWDGLPAAPVPTTRTPLAALAGV